jgi:hypothetical protein
MNYYCPYCKATRTKKAIFKSWKSVITHSNYCEHNTNEYIINTISGPIHYTYFLDRDVETLKQELGVSKYRDMLDKFRLAGFIKPDNSKKYTREECITAIQNKAKELGKTPTNEHFRRTEGKYPCIQYIVEMFGSWNAALTASGLELNYKSTLYGVPTTGLDGHLYRSKAEATFANKFLYGKYEYIIEPKYPDPYHKWYDWYIVDLDIYIELDGNIRPEVSANKKDINKKINRRCLLIPTYIIKSPNKNALLDFLEYEIT